MFEIGIIVDFVGIDEGKVERAVLPAGTQGLQGLQRRSQAQIDLVRHARFLPITPGDGGILIAEVAGNQPPVIRQRAGHRQGAVAGKYSDLQTAAGAEQLDQQTHELSLLR